MPLRASQAVLFGLLLLVPLACDSSARGDGNSGSLEPRPVSDEQRAGCAAYAQALCARVDACSPYNIPNFYGTVAYCEAETRRSCERSFALPGNTQTLERLDTCTASLPTAVCLRAFGGVIGAAECADPPGTLGSGSSCMEDSECASDRCDLDLHSHCYSCVAGPKKTAPLGADCDPVDGPDCDEGICYLGQCITLSRLNEACDSAGLCEGYLPCRNGVCSAPQGEGAACTSDADCLYGYKCTQDKCTATPPDTASVGDGCGLGIMHLCNLFTQYCSATQGGTGTCQLKRQLGEGCGYDAYGDDSCASGLACIDGACQIEPIEACL